MGDDMSFTSEISKSILLDVYNSGNYQDFDSYVGAMYYAESREFIENSPSVEELQYQVFITGESTSVGENIFYELFSRINSDYLYSYDEYLNEGLDEDDAVVYTTVDCSLNGVKEDVRSLIAGVNGQRTFVSFFNIDKATNDTLLWLADWLAIHDENLVITLEAEESGSHAVVLGLNEF